MNLLHQLGNPSHKIDDVLYYPHKLSEWKHTGPITQHPGLRRARRSNDRKTSDTITSDQAVRLTHTIKIRDFILGAQFQQPDC